MKTRRRLSVVRGTVAAAVVAGGVLAGAVAQADTAFGPIQVLNHAKTSDGKCLDVKSEDIERTPLHARVQAWDCSGASEQQWSSHPYAQVPVGEFGVLETLYQIKNLRTGECMEITGDGSLVTGVQADEVPCGTGSIASIANQLWIESPSGRGDQLSTWAAATGGASLCLDLKGDSNENGTPIQQWTCNGTLAQVFGGALLSS